MKLKVRVFTKDRDFGTFEYEAGKKDRVKDLERHISREIVGEDFRRITLVEDFMRAVFSSSLTIPLRICDEANLLAAVQEHGKVRLNYLFERSPVVFEVSTDGEERDFEMEELRQRMYSSGHYVGMYATPDVDMDDLTEFVNRRRRLPVDTSSVPEKVRLSARMGRKKVEAEFDRESPFYDVAVEIFRGLGLEEYAYFSVYKGEKSSCLLLMEYPPHSVVNGFSYTRLSEVVAAFKGEFTIDYDGEKDIVISAG